MKLVCVIKVFINMSKVINLEELRTKKQKIFELASQYGVSNVRVFGSVAKKMNTAESDIDFLVTLDQNHTLLDLGGFLTDLQELLNCKIDIVCDDSLHPDLKDTILMQAQAI